MRKITSLITTFSLATALAIGAPAFAQDAPAAAASTLKLDVGTTVYDSEGAAIGPIASTDAANVVLTVGDKQIALPKTSFMESAKGPAITITLAQLNAGIEQQAAASAAALEAALQPGADVRSAAGAVVVGKVKLADAEGVVLTTTEGDMRLPKTAFFMSPQGLATSFTAEQFAAAIADAKAAGAASTDAVADADPAPAAEPAQTPAD